MKNAVMETTRLRTTDHGPVACADRSGFRCSQRSGGCAGLSCPGWWRAVPEEERALLWSLVRMLQSAKRSRVGGVVRAARKWESCLGCFMKVRLLNSCLGRRGQAFNRR
jgi:hypothetical protein